MPDTQEIITITSLIIGSIGGLIAAFKAITEMRQNLIQRKVEHSWKQTEQAREFLKEIKNDYQSSSALKMIDWSGRSYKISDDTEKTISSDEVIHGLRTTNLKFSQKEGFIRDCFDSLYEQFEIIEHFIIHDFVRFEDISTPLEYYVNKMNKNSHYTDFMNEYEYKLAEDFIARFNQ